jgi:hypothetical protein
MSPVSNAEMSAFPVGCVDQEAGLGVGDNALFDKIQTVPRGAIVENKRLSAVLEQ